MRTVLNFSLTIPFLKAASLYHNISFATAFDIATGGGLLLPDGSKLIGRKLSNLPNIRQWVRYQYP